MVSPDHIIVRLINLTQDSRLNEEERTAIRHALARLAGQALTPPVDRVRVMRLLVYDGPLEWVQSTIERAIHGTRIVGRDNQRITGVTLDEWPAKLHTAVHTHEPELPPDVFTLLTKLVALGRIHPEDSWAVEVEQILDKYGRYPR